MRDSTNQVNRLRARIAQNELSEDELTLKIAEIIAVTSERMEAEDGLLLSKEIWVLQKEWRKTRPRPVN